MSPFRAGTTLRDAVKSATAALQAAGIEDAAGDARRLLVEAAGADAIVLIREPERALSADEAARLTAMIARRAAHEPVARILGWREFYGRRFAVTPDVLDPRADTETVVEAALAICDREGWRAKPIRILDLGTGSGCILITLLAELPQAIGVGLDVSEAARQVAKQNAETLGVAARASFQRGDMRQADVAGFDLVVSNPPYIRSGDIAGLAAEVAKFDPHQALDGGRDGLDFYRDILQRIGRAQGAARSQQWLVLEAGIGQAVEILDYSRRLGFSACDTTSLIRNDLNGVARCVAIKTRGG